MCFLSSVHSVVSDSLPPTDCSLPGSSIHGIFQTIVLEWVAIQKSALRNECSFEAGHTVLDLTSLNLPYFPSVTGLFRGAGVESSRLWVCLVLGQYRRKRAGL